MNKRIIALSLIAFFWSQLTYAQQQAWVPNELIVQLSSTTDAKTWIKEQTVLLNNGWHLAEQLSRAGNIWLLRAQSNTADAALALKHIQTEKNTLLAQYNHYVELRATPNDALYSSQWQYENTGQEPNSVVGADLDADLAWDVTTGGLTATGDTIVVAVIDNGIDLDHVDFQQNRWVNHAEIPNNGEDDDNNGYIDDYLGWNVGTDDDDISGGGHGTPVAGIIGADGNNNLGVTGVNWQVKVMIIKNPNFNTTEARVIEAYSYPLEQRQRYNASGGTEGAFVVATNASWGRKFGRPEDAPVWCNFYDMLGQHGILNIGATVNEDLNVDEVGDLPTTCESDFLVSVTNLASNDEKIPRAGYGTTHIDLGAYGQGAFTIANGNRYEGFAGTSSATPHVTGTVGLLYSLNCPTLIALTENDPAAAALLVREAILSSVTPNASLNGITVTNGRLNLNNAVQYLINGQCDGCIPATSARTVNIVDTQADIRWNSTDVLDKVDIRWRVAGTSNWQTGADVSSPFQLSNLEPCQTYEYELQSTCGADVIAFANTQTFQTEGCCEPPVLACEPIEVAEDQAFLCWQSVFGATRYELRIRPTGTNEWQVTTVADTSVVVGQLDRCTDYELQLRTRCGADDTDWSSSYTFVTLGCGPCLDQEYCSPDDLDPDSEYIESIEITGILDNRSGQSSSGYSDFGGELPAVQLEQGALYPIRLEPEYTAQRFQDAWRIWIDLDHNGSFTSNEIVYSSPGASSETVEGAILIPADARLGLTRMRVIMRFLSAGSPCPFGDDNFGEAEDYCVEIMPSSVCPPPGAIEVLSCDSTTFTIGWPAVGPAINYSVDYRSANGTEWLPVGITDTSVVLTNLDSATNYTLRVQSNCFMSESETFSFYDFSSVCITNASELIGAQVPNWLAYPNPVAKQLNLQWKGEIAKTPIEAIVYNMLGQRIQRTNWPTGQTVLELDWGALQAGLYTVTLYRAGIAVSSKRVVKQ